MSQGNYHRVLILGGVGPFLPLAQRGGLKIDEAPYFPHVHHLLVYN